VGRMRAQRSSIHFTSLSTPPAEKDDHPGRRIFRIDGSRVGAMS
jgi:hypothetical protein